MDATVAGTLRQIISIETRTSVESHGSYVETWSTTERARIAAAVEPLQGRELERASQIDPRISHRVTLRYWPAYRTDLAGGRARVVYHQTSDSDDDRVLEVVTPPVDVDESHWIIRVLCRETV